MSAIEAKYQRPSQLIIDFDSTFIKFEALDELADISLMDSFNKDTLVEEVKRITALGMAGKMPFSKALESRLALISPNWEHINTLIERIMENVTKSFTMNKQFIWRNAEKIYVISGGFKEYILPVTREFGIADDHILANEFLFDEWENIVGFDEKNLLAQDDGKVKQIKALNFEKVTWVVGDGYTDYQIKEAGLANVFILFIENIRRPDLSEKADFIACNFGAIMREMR